MTKKIILASSSPRRIEMMQSRGFDPEIIPADVDETLPEGIGMRDAVMFLALKKALAVEALLKDENRADGQLIIAADTVVYKDGIIGKPKDRDDALSMLMRIKNTSHYVATGVAIIGAGEPVRECFAEVTTVFCSDYSESQLSDYLDSDEPYDKAGAYAIQGWFSRFIDHYDGDFDNVVGFPWSRIEEKLRAF